MIRPVGEGGLILRFGTEIDLDVNKKALSCLAALDEGSLLSGVTDMLPSYSSVLVHFDPTVVSYDQVQEWCVSSAHHAIAGTLGAVDAAPRTITIPVHYGGEDGPDTDEVVHLTGLGNAMDVAKAHYQGKYRVYFLGFTGGFPYLGGLPDVLAPVPRLSTPRQIVPKGAVGIAAGQTGVYTMSTPGGWHLLGKTAEPLFDPSQDPPALLRAGDEVRFVPTDEPVPPEPEHENAPPPVATNPWVEVLAPGPLTSVQDLGRQGYARHGV